MSVLYLEQISEQSNSLLYGKAVIMIINGICSKKWHMCINSNN